MRHLWFVILAACDPGFTVQGTVIDAADRPVANCKVSFVCDGAVQDTEVTDAHGRFHRFRLGVFGDSCALEVRDGDHRALNYPIMEHCTKRGDSDLCAEVTLNARLPWESGAR